MSKIANTLMNLSMGLIIGTLVIFPFFYAPNSPKQPYSIKKLSSTYTINEKKAISRSVKSSVQIFSLDMKSYSLASLSGTYFTYNEHYYVFTSAHGILGECSKIKISFYKSVSSCIELTYIDKKRDYAIIQVEKMNNRTPVNFPNVLANPKKSFNLLDKVYYTGYPNNVGPTTWHGTIAGYGSDYLILQSYAWSGASGSGVFDEKGNLVGIIMALDTGDSRFGMQVLNNFVIITPVWIVEWEKVFKE